MLAILSLLYHHCNAKVLNYCSHHQFENRSHKLKSKGKSNFPGKHTTVVTYGMYSHNVYNKLPAVFSFLERKLVANNVYNSFSIEL